MIRAKGKEKAPRLGGEWVEERVVQGGKVDGWRWTGGVWGAQ